MQNADYKMPYDGEAFKKEVGAFFEPRKRRKTTGMRKRKGRCLGGAKVKR